MIVVRLARGGKKSKPFYRVVVADQRFPRDGRFIERLGYYNPVFNREGDLVIEIDLERFDHWVKQGAQPTPRVANLSSVNAKLHPKLLKQRLPAQDAVLALTPANLSHSHLSRAIPSDNKKHDHPEDRANTNTDHNIVATN